MRKVLVFVLLIWLSGCTPTIEYGRRSVNEPAFPITNKFPSVIINSTAQSSLGGLTEAGASGALSQSRIRFNFDNKSPNDIVQINKAFSEKIEEDPKFQANKSVLKRTIVAAITKGDFRPADRFVNFRLRITPKNFDFVDYKGTQSDYSQINIEKISLNKTNTSGIEITGGKPVGATLKSTNERSLSEAGDVTARIENLTTNIDFKTLDVYREAERGIDLAGNTLVNVSVTAQRDQRDKQIGEDWVVTALSINAEGQSLQPAKASLKTSNLQYLSPQDLIAKINFDYVIRRVLIKSNEYSEYNQTILYEIGSCEKDNAIIVRGRDFDIPRWAIVSEQGNKKEFAIQISSEYGNRTLIFTDYSNAIRFSNWMMEHKASSIGRNALMLPKESRARLNGRDYPVLSVAKSSENYSEGTESHWKCTMSEIQSPKNSQ